MALYGINTRKVCVALFVVVVTTAARFKLVSANFADVELLGDIFGQGISLLAGQKYESGDSIPPAFKEYALNDDSNENLGHATPQEMLTRAGFGYEDHYVVSDDGYVTQLVRIINPMADQRMLKQPPVMLLQGGITDISIWVWSSISQHHPEKYPRTSRDGPMTSWNRSMALTLSNYGYDVWLCSHRGANEQNQGHVNLMAKHKFPGRKFRYNQTYLADLSQNQRKRGMVETLKYWDYTFDEIADFETPRHIDRVLAVTGAANVTFVPMSFSTIYALMALARSPHYQRKIHNTVTVGPIINNHGTNRIMGIFHSSVCNLIPVELGTIVASEVLFSQPIRDLLLQIGKSKDWRYAFLLEFLMPLTGASARFQTLLEPAVFGHVLMPTGFKMIKHYCQIVTAGKFKRFDHGAAQNKKLYGDFFAPEYDLDAVDLGNWLVVSGDNDALATPKSVKQYMKAMKSKPVGHILVRGYNHLDLWAATDNDIKINLPMLDFLDSLHMPPQDI